MLNYELIEIDDLSDLGRVRDKWINLLSINNSKNIYTDPDFYFKLFNSPAIDAKPLIILLQINNTPKAIIIGWTKTASLPLRLGYTKFQTCKLTTLEIEIGGLITDGDYVSKGLISDYLSSKIKNKNFDLLLVNHLSKKNTFYDIFESGLIKNNKTIIQHGREWSSQFRDNETGILLDLHNSRTKQTFRRKDRKILNNFGQKLEVKIFSTRKDVPVFLKYAETISKKSYHLALGVGVENNEYWRNFFTNLADGNYFRGYLLISGETPIAYYQGAIYKDVFYAFTTAYNSDYYSLSPGSYLIRRVIEHCREEKLNSIHFGYGDAEYKQLYGTDVEKESSFKIYGYTLSAKYSKFLDIVSTSVNSSLVGIFEKIGILKKIKKLWRVVLRKQK